MITLLIVSSCDRIKETYSMLQNSIDPSSGTNDASSAVQIYAVNTMPAASGQIRDYLLLSGDIIASSIVDTYSDAAGKVSRLYVSIGSKVKKGDPVVAVDPSRPGMEFVASVVRAPVAGTIIALPAQLGMTVSQAVPIARISGGAGLETRLYVAERFISKVNLYQSCEITLDAYPGEIFRGSITEVSPTVDTTSRTMEIRVGVENSGSRLKAGMFAKVRIITETKEDVVKIPASAVVNRFGEQYVFSVDKSNLQMPVARKRVIVPGIVIDGVMEVRQGLAPNEDVVVRGQTLLEDGSRVNVIEQLSPLSAN
jgi:multidrug efflux pump subunit AcrA (membrane-fusion protein)